jgi:hypothetical protein
MGSPRRCPPCLAEGNSGFLPQLAEGAFLVILRLPVVTLALPAAGARARLDAQSHLRGVRVRVAAAERARDRVEALQPVVDRVRNRAVCKPHR